MKNKLLLLSYSSLLFISLVSCGPPESYETGMNFYNVQKYDSAMYYFDRLLPDDKEWMDSAKIMKGLCLEKMITRHDWVMYCAQLGPYGRDTALMNKASKILEKELLTMARKDSTLAFYKVYDAYLDKFSSEVMSKVMTTHIDEFLSGSEWDGRTGFEGQRLIFERDKDGMQGKSNKTMNGWNIGKTIYKNISYRKEGVMTMKPRIWGYWGEYFGGNGSMRFMGSDTLKINYGTDIRGGAINYFVRGKKLSENSEAKKK